MDEVFQSAAQWKQCIEKIISVAANDGYIITVHTQPRLPLAMGNYDLVVDVRERRVMAEPIVRPVWPAAQERLSMYDLRQRMGFEADPMRNETLLPPGTTEVHDKD